MSLLELKDLSFSYKDTSQRILSNINKGFERGVFYSIIGKSGAGKSTLLSLMAGLDDPSIGNILYEGQDIRKIGYQNYRRKDISLVFQSYNLIDYLSPLENIRLVKKDAGEDNLLKLGLDKSLINRNIKKLSGGQQQRVAIARALVSEAPIILADEPTGNLDEATSTDIINILKQKAKEKNKCVIVVTHSKKLAMASDCIFELVDKDLVQRQY